MNKPQSPSLDEFLRSTKWLQVLPEKVRERVVGDCFEKIYAPRDVVANEGEPASSWIGVIDGLLKISTITATGRSMMFTAVPSGSWVGEGSVIKRETRKYDVLALRETRVAHVPRATFMWLLETSLEFSRFVIDHLNERTGQFIGMLEVGRIMDPTARVAGALSNLFNNVLSPSAGPILNISQEEVGELAGISRGTANIAIGNLKKLQLVVPEYGGLLILDIERLKRLAFAEEITRRDTEK